jgi:hypothetical protein
MYFTQKSEGWRNTVISQTSSSKLPKYFQNIVKFFLMFCVSSKELIKIPNNKLDRFQNIHQDFHNNVLQAQPVQRVQQTQLPSLTQLFYLREVFVLGPEQQLDSAPVEIWSDLNEAGTSKQPPLLPPPSRWSNASRLPFQGPML